jgi:hypothetical protein
MKKYNLLIVLLFIFYIILMTGIMIWQGVGIAPDRYAFVLLLGSLLIKRTRSFLLDWVPFLFILISYDFLRSLSPTLNPRVHYQSLIDGDLFLFHQLPNLTLQQMFFNPNHLGFLDYFTTIFYFLHFALPLAFGFLLWIYNKNYFRLFVIALCLMSYMAWVSYVIYPAAPPWLAQEKGYISGVTKIMNQTLNSFPDRFHLPTVYTKFNPNPTAAMPSMHAAYPFLVLLFSFYFFGKKALIFTPYVFMMWFSLVYLGEHYVVDILAGIIYASAFFGLTVWLKNNYKKFKFPIVAK